MKTFARYTLLLSLPLENTTTNSKRIRFAFIFPYSPYVDKSVCPLYCTNTHEKSNELELNALVRLYRYCLARVTVVGKVKNSTKLVDRNV